MHIMPAWNVALRSNRLTGEGTKKGSLSVLELKRIPSEWHDRCCVSRRTCTIFFHAWNFLPLSNDWNRSEAMGYNGSSSFRLKVLERENELLKARLEDEKEKEKAANAKTKEEERKVSELEAAQRAQKADELRMRRMVLQAAGKASGAAALGAGALAILTKGSIAASFGNLFRSFGGSSLIALALRGNVFGVKFRTVEWDLATASPEGRMKTVVLRILSADSLRKEIARANGLGSPNEVLQMGHWVGDFIEMLPAKGYIGYLPDPCWIVWTKEKPCSMGGRDMPPRVVKVMKLRERPIEQDRLTSILVSLQNAAEIIREQNPANLSTEAEEKVVQLFLARDERMLALYDAYFTVDPSKFFRIARNYVREVSENH